MKTLPRILPLIGVAVVGVLGLNALAGARDLPGLLSGARAFAEEAAKDGKTAKGDEPKAKAKAGEEAKSATGAAVDVSTLLPPAQITPRAVCAPTAAELAKEAGLSPAELQILQSLGERRGHLDKRESDLDTQLALMAAAEAKLDAKIRTLKGLKGDVSGLLNQATAKEAAEIDRLVKVFEGMKAKDAAPRMVLLDDSVRLPIAAKMKERALSSILAVMPAPEAKRLTESLAGRFTDVQNLAAKAEAAAPTPTPTPAKPAPKAQAKADPAAKAAPAPAAAPPAKAG